MSPVAPDGSPTAAADPEEPVQELSDLGVRVAHRFGFSVRQIDNAWLLRVGAAAATEQLATFDAVINRALAVFYD